VIVVCSPAVAVAGGPAFEDVSAAKVVRAGAGAPVLGGAFLDLDRDGDRDLLLVASPWPTKEVAPEPKDPAFPKLGGIAASFDDDDDRDVVLADADALAEYSMDAAPVDVDGDGDLDVVVALEFHPNRLYLNDGKGVLTEESWRLPQFVHDSEDIAVADFDRDGDRDVVVVSEDDETNEHYVNDGKGVFLGAGHLLPVRGISNIVEVLDVDLDGAPDLVIGNQGQNFILINDGTGRFRDETATRLPVQGETTQDVAIGDVDGDDDPDLVFANEAGLDRLVLNDGHGHFAPAPEDHLPPPPTATDSRDVELADVDGDGDLDLFFGVVGWSREGLTARNRLLINDGTGVFMDETDTRLDGPDDDTLDGVLLDLDGDGDLDLVTSHTVGDDPAALIAWENDGTGRFTPAPGTYFGDERAGDILAIVPADFDGDGATDLFIANRGAADQLLLRRDRATPEPWIEGDHRADGETNEGSMGVSGLSSIGACSEDAQGAMSGSRRLAHRRDFFEGTASSGTSSAARVGRGSACHARVARAQTLGGP
jgi:hypothetical protein